MAARLRLRAVARQKGIRGGGENTAPPETITVQYVMLSYQ